MMGSATVELCLDIVLGVSRREATRYRKTRRGGKNGSMRFTYEKKSS